jgi:hypothetical protein
MAFKKSTVSPPCIVEPGSCQAVRIEAALSLPVERVPVTPEWIEQNQLKQLRYERDRAAWRKLVGTVGE